MLALSLNCQTEKEKNVKGTKPGSGSEMYVRITQNTESSLRTRSVVQSHVQPLKITENRNTPINDQHQYQCVNTLTLSPLRQWCILLKHCSLKSHFLESLISQMVLRQIKRKWHLLSMDPCSHLSVADSYGSHSHHVIALKFICNKRKTKHSEQSEKKH